MTMSDETLMAYADGELDAAACAAVEAQMRQDPHVEAQIAQHRRLREQLSSAYAPELLEPIPERLLGLLEDPSGARARERNRRSGRAAAWWRPLGALAASILLGIAVGYRVWHRPAGLISADASAGLVARGALAAALSDRLAASPPAASEVQIGLSFLAKSGDICRTFGVQSKQLPAGIACRHDGEWQIQTLAPQTRVEGAQEYRQAASQLPAAVVKSVEEQMVGEPLDAQAEAAARARGWRP